MRIFKIVILVIIIGLFIVFVLQNNTKVEIRYFIVSSSSLPLWLVVFIALFIGLFVGWIFSYINEMELRKSMKKKNKEFEELKKEVEYLRNLPITEKGEQKAKEIDVD